MTNTQKLSEYLGVSPAQLKKLGVLDAVIGIDSNLFVDPHLLNKTRVPEFKESRRKLEGYFTDIIKLLTASQRIDDVAWREAQKRLIFHELRGVSIGYGVKSSDGRAVGRLLGRRLVATADEIIKMGIKDPAIFELIGLFEDGFGADRLSDMTISILKHDFYSFTERVAKSLNVGRTAQFKARDREYVLPVHPDGKRPLIFLPTSLLRDLPVAFSWEDIDRVVSVNRELRDRLNSLIGGAWERRTKIKKRDLRNLIFSSPDNIKLLVDAYRKNRGEAYDIDRDPNGEIVWYELGRQFAATHRLEIKNKSPRTVAEVEEVVSTIIQQFRRQIEFNGLNEHLYANGKPRPERFSQRLFYSVADSYCDANDMDISPESNAGSGAVDFKLSRGRNAKTLVEIKLSSNRKLIGGYEKQIEAYKQSERTRSCFYVVIQVTKSSTSIKRLLKMRDALLKRKEDCPEIVIIDGVIKPSASRR